MILWWIGPAMEGVGGELDVSGIPGLKPRAKVWRSVPALAILITPNRPGSPATIPRPPTRPSITPHHQSSTTMSIRPILAVATLLILGASILSAQAYDPAEPEIIPGPRCTTVSTPEHAAMTWVDADGVVGSDHVIRVYCSGEVRVGTFEDIAELSNGGGLLLGTLPQCGGLLKAELVVTGIAEAGESPSFEIRYREPVNDHLAATIRYDGTGRNFTLVTHATDGSSDEERLDVR